LLPLISHELLDALGLCAGIIVAIPFQQVDDTPDAQTRAKGQSQAFAVPSLRTRKMP